MVEKYDFKSPTYLAFREMKMNMNTVPYPPNLGDAGLDLEEEVQLFSVHC